MNFFQRIIVPLREREEMYSAKIRQSMTAEERESYNYLVIGTEIATANQVECDKIETAARERFEESGELSPLSAKETERFWTRAR